MRPDYRHRLGGGLCGTPPDNRRAGSPRGCGPHDLLYACANGNRTRIIGPEALEAAGGKVGKTPTEAARLMRETLIPA
jgi:hypothetical protein